MGALGLSYWLEHWLDYASVQATLLDGRGVPVLERIKRQMRYYRRVQHM